MKKYNYQEFKNDPRTGKSRGTTALLSCIDSNKTSPEEIFSAIDKAFETGTHKSPSYIKRQKKQAIKLLQAFGLG